MRQATIAKAQLQMRASRPASKLKARELHGARPRPKRLTARKKLGRVWLPVSVTVVKEQELKGPTASPLRILANLQLNRGKSPDHPLLLQLAES